MIKLRKEALIFSVLFLIIALVGSIAVVSAEVTYSCDGASADCGNIYSETQCSDQNGCRWDDPTIGFDECISTICDLGTEQACEDAGCKWKSSLGGGDCVGDFSTPCSDLTGDECIEQMGCTWNCNPDCTGKNCGADGCGGSCGTCDAGEFCEANNCEPFTSNEYDDTIMFLSGWTNAHGEKFNIANINYKQPIFYSEIFGWEYVKADMHQGNIVLALSSNTNAHAQIPFDVCAGVVQACSEIDNEGDCDLQEGCKWDETGFPDAGCMTDCEWHTNNGGEASCEANPECSWNADDETCNGGEAKPCEDIDNSGDCQEQNGCEWIEVTSLPGGAYLDHEVQYGDLDCRAKHIDEGECNRAGEECIVRLSDWTNAHMETCDNNNYPIQICCSSQVDCSQFEYKNNTNLAPEESCDYYDQCAWYPLINSTGQKTTSNADGGGCCEFGEKWDNGECVSTFDTLCNNPWTLNNIPGETRQVDGNWEYCAQVTPGVSTGYWTPIEEYN